MLKEKLKGLKKRLKEWNLEHFGLLDRKEKEAGREMNELERKVNHGELGEEERNRKLSLQEELWKIVRHNESLARQKVRARWVVEGDRNSKYFNSTMPQNFVAACVGMHFSFDNLNGNFRSL